MMSKAMKYTADDVPEYFIRMHQRKKDAWVLIAYVCPDCGAFYKGLRIELFRHENVCKGKPKKSLED